MAVLTPCQLYGKERIIFKGTPEIIAHLGNEIKDIIWGEKVWKKGEVNATPAMSEAYQAGLGL